jgi:hypothetical protein
MSLEPVLVIHIVDTKSNGVTIKPFEVVQQRPCKVSLHVNPIPIHKRNVKEIKLAKTRERERERESC